MAARKKYTIGDQLDSLQDDEFSAKLVSLMHECVSDNLAVRTTLSQQVHWLKRAGMFKYYFLVYELVKACHEHNMYVSVNAKFLNNTVLSALCDLIPGDREKLIADPEGYVSGSRRKEPGFATITCAPSLRPVFLRSMMKTMNATVRLHTAVAFRDNDDIDGSSLGILFNVNPIDMADIVLTHRGCHKYMPWKHPFIDVCNDMICIKVEGRVSMELPGTFSYLAQTLCPMSQAPSLYPAEFYASLIRCCSSNQADFETATALAVKANELVLLPHINYSKSKCWVIDYDGQRSVILGLSDIDGLDIDDAKAIIAERKDNGPFLDQEDFVRRCQGRVLTDQAIRSVIHSGASITHDSVFLQRCFQYNATLFSRSYSYSPKSLDVLIDEVSPEVTG